MLVFERSIFCTLLIAVAIWLAAPYQTAKALALDKEFTQFTADQWRTAQGLPELAVQSILQTKDGYLWVGTQNGLARFDGYQFKVFDHTTSPAFRSDFITALSEDSNGNLWIGTSDGVLARSPSGDFFEPTGLNTCQPTFVFTITSRRDTIWAAGSNGAVSFSPAGVARCLTLKSGLPNKTVSSFATDASGLNWFTSGGRLFSIADGDPIDKTVLLPMDTIAARVFPSRSGGIVVVDSKDAIFINVDQHFHLVWRPDNDQRIHVRSVLYKNEHEIWIGTEAIGLLRLKSQPNAPIDLEQSSQHWIVQTLFEDSGGNLWLGTLGDGLCRFRDGPFITVGTQQGLSAPSAFSILVDEANHAWAGTINGLTQFDGHTASRITTKDGLASNQIGSLAKRRMGGVWIGERGSIVDAFVNRKAVERIKLRDTNPNSSVSAILEDSAGRLWMGTNGAGLALRVSQSELHYWTHDSGLPGDFVRAIVESSDGAIWIATDKGVAVVSADDPFTRTFSVLSPGVDVMSLREESGVMWVGTLGKGIFLFRSWRLWKHIGTPQGLLDDTANGILFDAEHNVWVGTNRGIMRIEKAQLDLFLAGESQQLFVRQYGEADGIKGADTYGGAQPSAASAPDGRLWFATVGGLIVVDPATMNSISTPLTARVEAIRLNGEGLKLSKAALTIPHWSRLEVEFSAPDISGGQSTEFRYKLSNFDDEWTNVTRERNVRFVNITPGQHTFEVQARQENSDWSAQVATVDLDVVPAFYESRWFMLTMLVVVALLLGILHRFRVEWLRIKSAIADERMRLAADLHDNLAQAFTAIAFQIDAAVRHDRATLSDELSHLAIARDIAATSQREVRQSLQRLQTNPKEKPNLQESIRADCGKIIAGRDIAFELAMTGKAWVGNAMFDHNVKKISQEATSNAIRHGNASRVYIRLHYNLLRLVITIADDGTGFDLDGTRDAKGFGIKAMRFRAQALRGQLVIKRLKNGGTQVIARVPRPVFWNPLRPFRS